MTQTAIPYHLFRGGTSRGPYFNRADLPADRDTLANVLIAALGSGQKLNIDGIGGGAAVTTKVAMLSKSDAADIDIDYFFAQVSVEDQLVDFKPTCGNILSGVGPAAIEMGLIAPQGETTRVRIRAVNTGAVVEAIVATPNGTVSYEGPAKVDGVPGSSAPIYLNFMGVVGSSTGALLPTGAVRDVIEGVEVTCMDVAMPIVIARAADFGLTGYESAESLDANRDFFAKIEPIRIKAGALMGLGDVTKSVTPKFALLAPPRHGGTITARYFMPWSCHPTMAVTGAQCLASCVLTPGTVAQGLYTAPQGAPALVRIEHAGGEIDVTVDYEMDETGFHPRSAGLLRTARMLARGEVFVPSSIWSGKT
ncbi:4-oxalomesaconate tautomerase [Albirhodobacter sp. R86504]|uniref:4-oxalomesaconate tautomerase n=1 Tax=Albirhodobacter sp. R86504 TaxID=3093848 RepID=UPI0036734DDD